MTEVNMQRIGRPKPVAGFPSVTAAVIALRAADVPFDEIARRTGCSESSLRTLAARARPQGKARLALPRSVTKRLRPYATMDRVGLELRESRLTARDVEAAAQRARALYERHGGAVADKARAGCGVSILGERATEEARKLRAIGWSILGLSKRYGLPPEQMAPVVGERWGAQ